MKRFLILKRAGLAAGGIAALCLALVAALCIISGFWLPQTYLEPWAKSYASGFSDPRVRLAADGLLAASNHNMQPWKIQLDRTDPMVFYLYADSKRRTNAVDPYARQFMVSQGTFLEYVRVAGNQTGWHTNITFFPNGTYDENNLAHSMDTLPVAKISLTKSTPQNDPLYNTLFLPDTNREAYTSAKLTSTQVQALSALTAGPGLSVDVYQRQHDLSSIGGYALQSAVIESGVSRVMDESSVLFRANEFEKNRYRYGYSMEGQGSTGFSMQVMQGLVTLFPSLNSGKGASENFIRYTRTSIDHTPAYAMIVSSDNSRTAQVESGMLYSRLVLTGHTLGLAMQPLSQALEEYPEMHAPYKGIKDAYAPGGGTIQMLFRVGNPTQNTPLSMRRDVKALLTNN